MPDPEIPQDEMNEVPGNLEQFHGQLRERFYQNFKEHTADLSLIKKELEQALQDTREDIPEEEAVTEELDESTRKRRIEDLMFSINADLEQLKELADGLDPILTQLSEIESIIRPLDPKTNRGNRILHTVSEMLGRITSNY